MQSLFKHALGIYVEATRGFFHHFFQLGLRFFADAGDHFAHTRIQFLLQVLGRRFEGFLLVSFLLGAVVGQVFAGAAAGFVGFALSFILRGRFGGRFWGGGFRILYSFPAGILLFRFRWILRTRLGFAATALLLVAAFLIPYSERTSRFVDPLVVILYFPFLVAIGAGAPLHPTLRHLCRFSGNISYPLYTIHYPLLWMFLSYVEARQPTIAQSTPIILVGTVLLVALAYGVFRCYDLPVRRYLRRTMIAYEPVPQT